ncbi:MAG TPA: hypothetical protein VE981_04900 [Planctomycetota bacterium]|nr:hypothetical protein [Planctomycetota bacterium]
MADGPIGGRHTLVAELQKHAREDHKLDLPRKTILAMAQPDPG